MLFRSIPKALYSDSEACFVAAFAKMTSSGEFGKELQTGTSVPYVHRQNTSEAGVKHLMNIIKKMLKSLNIGVNDWARILQHALQQANSTPLRESQKSGTGPHSASRSDIFYGWREIVAWHDETLGYDEEPVPQDVIDRFEAVKKARDKQYTNCTRSNAYREGFIVFIKDHNAHTYSKGAKIGRAHV